jgi:uncharacterized protein (UPF0335 family)
LNEEKKNVLDDIKDFFDAAKSNGLEPKIIKTIVRLRARRKDDILEEEALLDMYKQALEM